MCTYDIIPHAGRIRHLILLLVVMLAVGLVPAATAATASFTATPVTEPWFAPCVVQFNDTSDATGPGIDNWTWNFADGSPPVITLVSTNLTNTFSNSGIFVVKLVVNESGVPDPAEEQINITPRASFFANPEDGYIPSVAGSSLPVVFTDNSTGSPSSWSWVFGDGTAIPTGSAVETHNYTLAGRFTVRMTATHMGLSNTTTRQVVVRPGSYFTQIPGAISVKAPMTWSFYDNSTGSPNAWSWTFGDGTTGSTWNPVHTFSRAGIYPVTLTASNGTAVGGPVMGEPFSKDFTVRPNASFTMSRSRGTVPLGVQFNSTTLGVPGYGAWWNTTYRWTFGDGNTSTEQNPFFVYTKPGRYTVNLTVTCGEGPSALSDTATATVWVNTARMPPFRVSIYNTFNPLLKANKAHAQVNEPVTFFAYVSRPLPTATAVDKMIYAWYYGDGYNPQTGQPNLGSVDVVYGPHGWVTRHAYAEPGSYPVACAVVNPVGDPTITVPTPYTITLSNIPLPGGGTANVNVQITVPAGYKLPDAMAYTVVYMPDFVEVRR